MPTSTSIMDSAAIAQFLNSTYPSPPLPLTSPIGQQIEAKARSTIGRAFATLVLPREPSILSTRSAAYFRAKTEASLGLALDDLLSEEKQGQAWELVEEEGMRELGEMLMTNRAEGPFVLGKEPSYTDFFVAGSLANVRVVDEGVFERLVGFEGFRGIYEACGAWMERNT
jgi:glutathione S-transferase